MLWSATTCPHCGQVSHITELVRAGVQQLRCPIPGKDTEAPANWGLEPGSDRDFAPGSVPSPGALERRERGLVDSYGLSGPQCHHARHTTQVFGRKCPARGLAGGQTGVWCSQVPGATRALGASEVQRQAGGGSLTATVPPTPTPESAGRSRIWKPTGTAAGVAPAEPRAPRLAPVPRPVTAAVLRLADRGGRGASESPAAGPRRARGRRAQEAGPHTRAQQPP